jgi:hypothetical protein
MELDLYQQAWQAQSSRTRVTIDADLLRKEVQRSQGYFQALIFWRDFREVVVSLLLIPAWFYLGARTSQSWTWYLTVPALIWVAGFMLVYRLRHPQKPSGPHESLRKCVRNSLNQVDDQIWMLRNVFWWYILPPGATLLVFFLDVAWRGAVLTNDWLAGLGAAAIFMAILLAVYYSVYYVNQYAVRTQLVPQRRELLALLAGLSNEPAGDVSGEYPILMSTSRANCSPRRMFVASLCAVAILAIGVPAILLLSLRLDEYLGGYPKKSPFAAVRWQEAQPDVQLGGEWFKLISLNDLPADEIVAFSQGTYGDKWRKRFEEDLVELLTGMGHPPGNTVKLVVQKLTTSETQVLEDVPMTRANRQAIWDAGQLRERNGQ